jgi:methanogenic corrinoid protein MtbC1
MEGELHDLPLIMLGLALRTHGWRVSYLGADTPVESLLEAVEELRPDAVVVSGTLPSIFEPQVERLRSTASGVALYLAGAAATEDSASRAGATLLAGGPLEAAGTLAARGA